MQNIYEVIVKPILTNQIIVDWIAPIITGLIVLILPTVIAKIIKTRNFLKNVNEINNKIINTIRPFIIQRIEINSSFITDIRNAIIKENQIREKYIFNEIEIRNRILLDISETRFLKENEKQELINFTYEVFKNFNEKQIEPNASYEEREAQKNRKISIVTYSSVIIISLIIMLVAYSVKPVDSNIEDNVVVLVSMITTIFAIIISLLSYIEINASYNSISMNVRAKAINEITDEFIKIKNKIKSRRNKDLN